MGSEFYYYKIEKVLGKGTFGNVYKGPQQSLGETAYKVINLEKVGHYAIRIFWEDRHSDGLFLLVSGIGGLRK